MISVALLFYPYLGLALPWHSSHFFIGSILYLRIVNVFLEFLFSSIAFFCNLSSSAVSFSSCSSSQLSFICIILLRFRLRLLLVLCFILPLHTFLHYTVYTGDNNCIRYSTVDIWMR